MRRGTGNVQACSPGRIPRPAQPRNSCMDFLNKESAADGVGYCVFGAVIDGMDVVEKIKGVKVGEKGMFDRDCPLEDVVIKAVRRAEAK